MPLFTVLLNELKSQFFSFAQKAAVFFSISRSIRTRRFTLNVEAIANVNRDPKKGRAAKPDDFPPLRKRQTSTPTSG